MSATRADSVATRFWQRIDEQRVQCDLCPRHCRLREGQRGLCYVRGCEEGEVRLFSYGRSSGFCVDPIEKKPLNHFLPGSSVLSFGTAGCNLACKFCQNWDISKSREMDTLADAASPDRLARTAAELQCRSVAFTSHGTLCSLHDSARASSRVGYSGTTRNLLIWLSSCRPERVRSASLRRVHARANNPSLRPRVVPLATAPIPLVDRYKDPVIFHEYAVDVAAACRERGIRSVAVTAGWICPEPRREFFAAMDAANVDLKAFSERFYRDICGGSLKEVLDTLLYLKHETDVWFELTTLLIPGENDSTPELERLTRWVADELGPDVPLHFTAFHPDWKLRDRPATPASTLSHARRIALDAGIHYAYTGNVHDTEGGSTCCPGCGACVIERDWYALGAWNPDTQGRCRQCGQGIAGVFEAAPGDFGRQRIPVRLGPPS